MLLYYCFLPSPSLCGGSDGGCRRVGGGRGRRSSSGSLSLGGGGGLDRGNGVLGRQVEVVDAVLVDQDGVEGELDGETWECE